MRECASCGKPIELQGHDFSVAGIAMSLNCAEGCTNEVKEFMQAQVGPYKLNHQYRVCYECLYKALGVKP